MITDTTVKCSWCLQDGHVWKDCAEWQALRGIRIQLEDDGSQITIASHRAPKPEFKWFGFAIFVSLAVVAILLVKELVS